MKTLQIPTFILQFIALVVFLGGRVGMVGAAVNDVVPGDFFPLSKGTSTLANYLYERKSEGPFVKGHAPVNGVLDTTIVALRIGHFFELGGQPLSLIAVLPWAKGTLAPPSLSSALGREASGMGDLRLGATQWLHTDRELGDYLAVSTMLSLPTGDYERDQVLTIGENRTKFTLSLGWLKTLSPQFVLELVPEWAWYGDNDRYLGSNLYQQASSRALTGYLRYRASSQWHFHVGGQLNWGGETRVNSIARDDAPNTRRLLLGMTYTLPDRKNQWIIRLADDTKVDNGFRAERELLLRYLRIY